MNAMNRFLLLAISALSLSCSSDNEPAPPIVKQLDLEINENESFDESITPIGGNGLLRIVRISGSDSNIATITGDAVSINRAFDYENPTDSNRDNIYKFDIRASDGSNQIVNNVSVTVVNVLEPAVTVPATRSYRENGISVVAVVLTRDLGNPSFTLSGSDSSLFSISNSGELSFVSPPDYENPAGAKGNVYEIEVTVSKGEYEEVRSMSITVEDVSDNLGPTITNPGSLNVPENTVAPITTLIAVDPDRDGFIFSLDGSAPDNQYFEINRGGSLSFSSKQDYENCVDQNTDCTYEVVVLATDDHGMAGNSERIFVVVTDVAVGYFAPPGMEELKSIVCSDASCDNYRDSQANVVFLEVEEIHAGYVTEAFRRSTVVELSDGESPHRLYIDTAVSYDDEEREIVSDLLALGYTSESDLIFSASLELVEFNILAEAFPNSIFVYAAGNDSASSILVDEDGKDLSRIEVAGDGTRRYFEFNDEGAEHEIDEYYRKFHRFNFYFEMREQNRFLVVGGSSEQVGRDAGYIGGLEEYSNSNRYAEDNFIAAPFYTEDDDYRNFAGTSASVPQVTSALATLKHVYPSLSTKQIMQLVLELAVLKPNDSENRDIPDPGVLDLTGLFKENGDILTLEEVRSLITEETQTLAVGQGEVTTTRFTGADGTTASISIDSALPAALGMAIE